jgi:hypothetical protein
MPGVMTDGHRWFGEFFIQDGRVAADYRAYLKRTFWPLSDTGAHVIVSAPVEVIAAEDFGAEVEALAQRLGRLAGADTQGR